MTGEQWLDKVRSMKKIDNINWRVFGDPWKPKKVDVVIHSDLGEDVIPIDVEKLLNDQEVWVKCVAICLVTNRMLEMLGINKAFGVDNISDRKDNHDRMTDAVNFARQHDPSGDITEIEWDGEI